MKGLSFYLAGMSLFVAALLNPVLVVAAGVCLLISAIKMEYFRLKSGGERK